MECRTGSKNEAKYRPKKSGKQNLTPTKNGGADKQQTTTIRAPYLLLLPPLSFATPTSLLHRHYTQLPQHHHVTTGMLAGKWKIVGPTIVALSQVAGVDFGHCPAANDIVASAAGDAYRTAMDTPWQAA